MIKKRIIKPTDIKTPLNRQASGRKTIKQRFHPVKRKMVDDLEDFIEMPNKSREEETKKDVVKFAALGGLEEVGRNMSFLEYKNEIIIIDAGLQFPEENTPGIDYIIPNVTYLEERKEKIKALIITHAHYDHIGAIPYIMEKLGNPTIYTTALTKGIIMKRQEEFPNSPKLDFEIVKNHDRIKFSDCFEGEFFGIIHSIPDTVSILLKTPAGNFVFSTDLKFDYTENGEPLGLDEFKWVGKQNIQGLFLDSTNAESPGLSVSEKTVEKNIDELFKKSTGRIIIGTFASMLTRLAEIIKMAEKHNRRVFVSGLSMKTNLQIAQNLGIIKVGKGIILPLEEINKYRDDKVLILSTGAQGEPNASLMKIVTGENRFVQIKPGDTIIFSSSVIAGNERAVQSLKDSLARQGAKVYHSKIVDIHASGHATGEELKTVIDLVKPKFFIPIHGYYFMRTTNAEIAQSVGMPKQNTLLVDNGQIIEFSVPPGHLLKGDESGAKITDNIIPTFYVMVDGLGVGDVGEIVMRDRRLLAQEGMVVIITTLDRKSGRFLKNPDIISRGFIYLNENKELIEEVRIKIKSLVSRIPKHQAIEADYLKSLIRDQIGQFLYNKTKRRPMILPVVIEV